MWCRHCQQETPALGPAGATGPRCGRCQRTSPPQANPTTRQPPAEAGGLGHDDEARRAIYRSLRSAHATIAAGEAARTLRYDVAESPLVQAMAKPNTPPRSRPIPPERPLPAAPVGYTVRGQLASWAIASLGATLLGLGVGLIGWSLAAERPELWNPGVAAALGGQGLMIIGLVQLLASLWNAARGATGKLTQMHEELRRLRRSSEEQAGRHAASPATFYAGLARGDSDETLVGNLRGQLDALSSRLR